MPAEADARRDVVRRVGQRLMVVAKPGVDRQVVADAHAVLHEHGRQPLRQLVAADAEADRLRVVLNVRQRQLIERPGGRAEEREGAERRRTRLTAATSGGMTRDARPETQRLLSA